MRINKKLFHSPLIVLLVLHQQVSSKFKDYGPIIEKTMDMTWEKLAEDDKYVISKGTFLFLWDLTLDVECACVGVI